MNDFYNLKLIINKEQSRNRLDKILTKKLNNISRSQVKILIENGNVKYENKVFYDSSYLVKEGEIFEVSMLSINFFT